MVLDEIADLQARAYAATGMRAWSADEIAELMALSHVHLMMARDCQSVALGFLCLSSIDGEGEVLSLAVDPNHWRKRTASRLLASLETDEKIAGLNRIVLEVAETNTNAISFYRMLGFTGIATRRGYYRIEGNSIDALLMERYRTSKDQQK